MRGVNTHIPPLDVYGQLRNAVLMHVCEQKEGVGRWVYLPPWQNLFHPSHHLFTLLNQDLHPSDTAKGQIREKSEI